MQVTRHTQLNMVIGHPLEHTQSPLLHNTVYQQLGLNSIMLAKSHTQLDALIQAIKTLSVTLTAVTMPYKEDVFHYLDDCSPEVALLKTANTLIQRNGQLHGYNTDIAGIAFAFSNVDLHEKQVLVIGAGGAARAMGYFLKLNRAKIIWMNRTMEKAAALAEEFGGEIISPNQLNKIFPDIIINTTPVGLYPHEDESPLPDYLFHENQTVFDMIYNPVLTKLLKQAQQCRANIISGLDMFIGQGLKQIELFSGNKCDDSILIDKLRKLLVARIAERK